MAAEARILRNSHSRAVGRDDRVAAFQPWRPCRILPAAFCGNDTVRGDNTFIAGRQQPWDKWYPTQKTGPNPHRPQRKAVMTQPRPTTLSWPSEHPRNPLPCGKSDSHGAKWLQEKGCCRVTQAGSLCKEFSRIVWTAAHPLPFLSLSSSSVSFCVSYTHTHTHTHPNTNDAALGASLVVQWLRLHASTPGTPRSIPGQGTKISHTTQQDQKKKKSLRTNDAVLPPPKPSPTELCLYWHYSLDKQLLIKNTELCPSNCAAYKESIWGPKEKLLFVPRKPEIMV